MFFINFHYKIKKKSLKFKENLNFHDKTDPNTRLMLYQSDNNKI